MPVQKLFVLGLALFLCGRVLGQEGACEPVEEVRVALDQLRELRGTVPYEEYIDQRIARIRSLIQEHPTAIEAYRALASIGQTDRPELTQQLRKEWLAWAEREPDNAVAQYAAGRILQHHDSARAIQFMEAAKKQDPNLYWAYLSLANTYQSGKFSDKAKAQENLAAFFEVCPATVNRYAHSHLARRGTPQLKKKVAETLRAALATETSRRRLQGMRSVWNLEFATTPPAEHDVVRRRVADDLARLAEAPGEDTAEWLDFLKTGHKQAGASPEELRRFEDRILEVAPDSFWAYRVLSAREREAHPRPEASASPEVWQDHLQRTITVTEKWRDQFPDEASLEGRLMDYYAYSEEHSDEEFLAQLDRALQALGRRFSPNYFGGRMQAAELLLLRQTQPQRALALAREVAQVVDAEYSANLAYDDRDEADYQRLRKGRESLGLRALRMMLEAHRQMGDVDGATHLRARVLSSKPAEPDNESAYAEVRGLLAEILSQPADALAFYKQSLSLRQRPAPRVFGVVRDRVTTAARRVHFANGGTGDGWLAYLAADDTETPKEGRWEERDRPMEPFSLSDLSGKTWKLKQLEGKKVLINFWATWCGPCQAELPKLQELYEQTKDRADLQILTMNVDEDLGLVAPYVKEKGLTMPVLPAFTYFYDNVDIPAIPTNWIVDGSGVLRLQQIGFDSAATDWAEMMLRKVDSAGN